jgi:hypothetical protein
MLACAYGPDNGACSRGRRSPAKMMTLQIYTTCSYQFIVVLSRVCDFQGRALVPAAAKSLKKQSSLRSSRSQRHPGPCCWTMDVTPRSVSSPASSPDLCREWSRV